MKDLISVKRYKRGTGGKRSRLMATRRVAGVLGGTALAAWAGVVGKNRYGAVNAEASRDETTTWDAQVDWFVVGAGSSGCVVATRLAKAFPSKRTLLVEAGDTDNIEEIQNAVDYFGKAEKVFGSDRDWSYATTQQKQLNTRALWWPRGKVLGGCSSFNTMVFLRGDKSDFDTWAKITGFPEWGFDGMLPFFKRIETHPGPKSVHGKDGPMTVAPLSDDSHFLGGAVHFVTKAFVSAAESLGICKNEDFALNGNLGAGPNDVNACAGRRCNSAAYLKSIGAYPDSKQLSCASTSPPNALHVWLCAQTTRIIFDENKRAVGVELKFVPRADDLGAASSSRELEGKLVTPSEDGCLVRIRVNKEVIVCSGAVNSPKLLMLSGVGPAAHLKSVGIPVVADLPGVGASLRDHLHVPMSYRIPQPVKPHSHSNICEGTLFTKVYPEETNPDYPSDLQVHCGTLFFHPDGFTPVGQGFTLTPSLIHPRSVGSLWLNSKDPDDFPVIEPHYLEDSYDMEVLKRGVKFTRKLGAKMLQVLGGEGKEHFPGHEVESDQAIEEYIRKYVGTMYHPACSAKMGAENDPVAVLDRTLKVRGGIQGVRVIDASSMPEIVGANTNATCLALGEKGAQIIIDEFILQACST